jgi:HK97 family phage major capsid protein
LITQKYRGSRAQLDAEAAELDAAINEAIETKSYSGLDDIQSRLDDLAKARKDLEDREEIDKAADPSIAKAAAFGGDLGGRARSTVEQKGRKPLSVHRPSGKSIFTTGRDIMPMGIDPRAAEVLHQGFDAKMATTVETKSFNTIETGFSTTTPSLLPAELMSGVVERRHEELVTDWIPTVGCDTLVFEAIVDSTTTNGITGPTAEGVTAPDVVLSFTSNQVPMIPLRATFGASWEVLADWSTILGYSQAEIIRQVHDVNNAQVLSGNGETGNMNGLLNQAGTTVTIPTTLPTTPANITALDYILEAINAIRVFPNVLGDADQLWLNPSDWYQLLAIKDTLGRSLIAPDPVNDFRKQIYGVDVHTTTAMPAGTGLLMDSRLFGWAILRQGVQIWQGYDSTDFSQGLQRWQVGWRGQIQVVRPGALAVINGLPTTVFTP